MTRSTMLVACAALAACSNSGSSVPERQTPPATPKPPVAAPIVDKPMTHKCVDSFKVSRDDSVLNEQRSVGPRSSDFQQGYEAEYIDPDAHTPVNVVARFQVGSTPILWFKPDKTAAVVNAAVLTKLTVEVPAK